MARRRKGGMDLLASMPWPVGIVAGVVAYVFFRYGIGWYFSSVNGPLTAGLGKVASGGSFAPIGWMFMALCWLAAGVS